MLQCLCFASFLITSFQKQLFSDCARSHIHFKHFLQGATKLPNAIYQLSFETTRVWFSLLCNIESLCFAPQENPLGRKVAGEKRERERENLVNTRHKILPATPKSNGPNLTYQSIMWVFFRKLKHFRQLSTLFISCSFLVIAL